MFIDYKKMIAQDKELEAFYKEVLMQTFMADKNAQSTLASMHTFYQMGMTPTEVAQWIKKMNSIDEDSD